MELAAINVPWGAPATALHPTPPPADLAEAHCAYRPPAPPPAAALASDYEGKAALEEAAELDEMESGFLQPFAYQEGTAIALLADDGGADQIFAPVATEAAPMNATSSRWADDEPSGVAAARLSITVAPPDHIGESHAPQLRNALVKEPRLANDVPRATRRASSSLPPPAVLAPGEDILLRFGEACGGESDVFENVSPDFDLGLGDLESLVDLPLLPAPESEEATSPRASQSELASQARPPRSMAKRPSTAASRTDLERRKSMTNLGACQTVAECKSSEKRQASQLAAKNSSATRLAQKVNERSRCAGQGSTQPTTSNQQKKATKSVPPQAAASSMKSSTQLPKEEGKRRLPVDRLPSKPQQSKGIAQLVEGKRGATANKGALTPTVTAEKSKTSSANKGALTSNPARAHKASSASDQAAGIAPSPPKTAAERPSADEEAAIARRAVKAYARAENLYNQHTRRATQKVNEAQYEAMPPPPSKKAGSKRPSGSVVHQEPAAKRPAPDRSAAQNRHQLLEKPTAGSSSFSTALEGREKVKPTGTSPGKTKQTKSTVVANTIEETCSVQAARADCATAGAALTLLSVATSGSSDASPQSIADKLTSRPDEVADIEDEPNKPIPSKNNPSGYKGVYPARGSRWQAQVNHRSIGGFPTAWDAGVAVAVAIFKETRAKARPKVTKVREREQVREAAPPARESKRKRR